MSSSRLLLALWLSFCTDQTVAPEPATVGSMSVASRPGLQKTAPETLSVSTDLGDVWGTVTRRNSPGELRPELQEFTADTVAFLKIPFALPPTDSHRFRPPRPLPVGHSWGARGPFSIDEVPYCVQELLEYNKNQDEDCLYLNVFVPLKHLKSRARRQQQQQSEPLPVLVYFFEGTWSEGGAADFDGRALAARHNMVVVVPNYRVGMLGFFASEGLFQESGTVGNWGLLDQRMALQWVRDHIAAFGGNPQSVGVWGVSAGAFSIIWHLLSPASRGLFHNAVVSSGTVSPIFFYQKSDAYPYYEWFAEEILECPVDDLVCLRKTDARVFRTGKSWLSNPSPSRRLPPWAAPLWPVAPVGVTVDETDIGLPDEPRVLLREGRIDRGVNLLIGATKDEGNVFMAVANQVAPLISVPPAPGQNIDMMGHALNWNRTRMQDIIGLWGGPEVAASSRASFLTMALMLRDGLFQSAVPLIAKSFSKFSEKKVYVYSLNEPLFPPVIRPLDLGQLSGAPLDYSPFPTVGDVGTFHTGERPLVWEEFFSISKFLFEDFVATIQGGFNLGTRPLFWLSANDIFPEHYKTMSALGKQVSCRYMSMVKHGHPNGAPENPCEGETFSAFEGYDCHAISNTDWEVRYRTFPQELRGSPRAPTPEYMVLAPDGGYMLPFPLETDSPEYPRAEKVALFDFLGLSFYDVDSRYGRNTSDGSSFPDPPLTPTPSQLTSPGSGATSAWAGAGGRGGLDEEEAEDHPWRPTGHSGRSVGHLFPFLCIFFFLRVV